MAVSVSDIIQRVRYELNINEFEAYVTGTTGTDAVFTVPDGTKFAVGDIVEFQDNGEQTLVRSISTNDLTTKRGHNGTGSLTIDHPADTVVIANPVVAYIQIKNAVSRLIGALWPYVWKKVTLSDITPSTTTQWYDLDTTTMDLIQVVQMVGSGATARPFFYGARGKTYPVAMRRDLPTSLVTSGVGLYLPYLRDATNAIKATVRKKVTDTVASSEYSDIEAGTMADMIVAGVTARLISMTDVNRTLAQDVAMGDETVRPGARSQLSAFWEQRYMELRNQYHMELMQTAPPMKKWNSTRAIEHIWSY